MTFVVGLLAATALFSAHLALYVGLRGRGSREALLAAAIMASTAWWAAGNAAEHLATSLSTKVVFANLEYLAITAIPVLWFFFGWTIYRRDRTGVPRGLPAASWIVPVLTSLLVWTDPWLGLVRRSVRLASSGGFMFLSGDYGPWFWVFCVFSYGLTVAGTILVIRSCSSSGLRRRQKVPLIAGALLPLAANVLFVGRIVPAAWGDPTPLALSATGLLLVLNLARFRFLPLVTAARARAIDHLGDSVIIVDRDGILAYANATAVATFSIPGSAVGRPVPLTDLPFSRLVRSCAEPSYGAADPANPADPALFRHEGRCYETRMDHVLRRGRCVSSVLVFLDVTRRVTAEEKLRASNSQLEERVEERTHELQESNLRLQEELAHRRRVEKQLAHDALHDPLTGLANRSLALSRIEQVILRKRRDPAVSFAVLFLDFDEFKAINDSWGHAAGDAFLSQMAARLKASVRDVDVAARVGGDQFLVLLDGLSGDVTPEQVTDRIVDTLCLPVALGPATVVPSASVGIVIATPAYRDPESILHDAEIALHEAKSRGRGQRVVFVEAMRRRVNEHSVLSAALRAAIASGGIRLAFQPVVALGEGAPEAASVIGWEVLARWTHESLGPVGPDRFIPIAEESGLIVPLGRFVLIETLKTAAALRTEGLIADSGPGQRFFAVNVSAIQLGDPDFPGFVLSSLDRLGLPRSILHLELTESAIMESRDAVSRVIEHLSAEGISFKLDDFGTGYSSLGQLHSIPIDCVKIDKGFVTDLDDRGRDGRPGGLVNGVISLSHALRKTVVAEGIETAEQAEKLMEYGCDCAQGYFFGKPVSSAELRASLRGNVPSLAMFLPDGVEQRN